MKIRIWITVGCLTVGVTALLLADARRPRPGSDEEVAALRGRMKELQRELDSVRDRLGRLELARGNARMIVHQGLPTGSVTNWEFLEVPSEAKSPAAPLMLGPESPRSAPRVWGEGEVNGWKYQDIPLVVTRSGSVGSR